MQRKRLVFFWLGNLARGFRLASRMIRALQSGVEWTEEVHLEGR